MLIGESITMARAAARTEQRETVEDQVRSFTKYMQCVGLLLLLIATVGCTALGMRLKDFRQVKCLSVHCQRETATLESNVTLALEPSFSLYRIPELPGPCWTNDRAITFLSPRVAFQWFAVAFAMTFLSLCIIVPGCLLLVWHVS